MVSRHFTPLSGSLSYYQIHYSDALRYVYVRSQNDQDIANAPKSGGVSAWRETDGIPFYPNQPRLCRAGLNARHYLV